MVFCLLEEQFTIKCTGFNPRMYINNLWKRETHSANISLKSGKLCQNEVPAATQVCILDSAFLTGKLTEFYSSDFQ